jgi:N-acetylglucosamine-6-sulfatase
MSPSTTEIAIPTLMTRLDALLVVLKTCRSRQCTHPWEVLHPPPPSSGGSRLENSVGEGDGEVHYFGDIQTLGEALDPKFDAYYASKGRVRWERCEEAYVRESEGVEYKGPGMGLGQMDGGGEEAGQGYMWHEVATELD